MTLTAAGAALVPRARSILTLAEEFVQLADSPPRPLSATLRLGVIPTVAPHLLPKVLPKLRGNYPQL